MAKEEPTGLNMNGWQKFLLWGITAVFGCGLAYNQINRNADDIKTNTGDIKNNTSMIHRNDVVMERFVTQLSVAASDIVDIKLEQKDFNKDMRSDMKSLKEYLMQFDYEKESKWLERKQEEKIKRRQQGKIKEKPSGNSST